MAALFNDFFFEEGESLKKGQILATLNLTEINAHVQQARKSLEKSKRDLKRAARLYDEGAATREQFDNAQTGFDVAQSQLNIAEFNLSYATITAPSDGKILKKLAEENELTVAGYPVYIFGSQKENQIIQCGVADKDIIRLSLGDSAHVFFSVFPNKTFYAIVSELAQSLDPQSGTFEVELDVLGAESKLISGFVAHVDIFPSQKISSHIVPIESIINAEGHTGSVFTIENNIARKIPVIIGAIIENNVTILKGIENIKNVVTIGAPYLQDGTQVNIVN